MLNQPVLTVNPVTDKYKLVEDFEIRVNGINIIVPKTYEYDGATIPKFAWYITFSPFQPDVMLPALVHDWLYCNEQVDRELADEIFHELLINNNVNELVATVMWGAVRLFGGLNIHNEEKTSMLLDLYFRVADSPNFDRYHFPSYITSHYSVIACKKTGLTFNKSEDS